jgi:hypothetical protein
MSLCTIYNYKKHSVVLMDKDKKQKPTQLELNYDARVANIPNLNVGSVVESVSVSDHLTVAHQICLTVCLII